MQREIVGIEQIHRAFGAEAVGYDGNAVERQRPDAPFEFENGHIAQRRKSVEQRAAHARRADDKVDLAARTFFHVVDRLLDFAFGDRSHRRKRNGLHPRVGFTVYAVKRRAVRKNRAQPREFEVMRMLQHEIVARTRYRRARKRNRVFRTVDARHRSTRRSLRTARRINIDDHAFRQVARIVYRVRTVRRSGNGAKLARAVAEEHSAEVEGRALQKSVHFVIEQVDERTLAAVRRADRLIGDLDRAVQIFERGNELRVTVSARGRQRALFRTRADAAVHAVAHRLSHVSSRDVLRRLVDRREQRIRCFIELFRHRIEIIRF